jgi:hypothetical protein
MQRRPRTLAFGAWLSARGAWTATGAVVASICVAVAGGGAIVLRRRGVEGGPALVSLSASAIAWGAGMLVAFGAALRAARRDQDEGVLELARARGLSVSEFVRGRVAGLAIAIGAVTGTATLFASALVVALLGPSWALLRACAGALAYALAFAATMAPLAIAALGGPSRSFGYAALVVVLVVPEVLSPWSSRYLPPGWGELTSLPSALAAVRAGVAAPVAGGLSLARALAGLAALISAALLVVGARVRAYGSPGATLVVRREPADGTVRRDAGRAEGGGR